MRYLSICIFLFALFLTSEAFGQFGEPQQRFDRFILLDKPGTTKRKKFYVGESISLRLKGEDYVISDKIVSLRDSMIYLDSKRIPPSSLNAVVNLKPKKVSRGLSKAAFLAIPPLLVFTVANKVFNTGEQPLLNDTDLRLMGVMAGIGIVMRIPPPRNYHLDKGWRLRILDVSPE